MTEANQLAVDCVKSLEDALWMPQGSMQKQQVKTFLELFFFTYLTFQKRIGGQLLLWPSKPRGTLVDFLSDLEVKVQEHFHTQRTTAAAAMQSQNKASLTCTFANTRVTPRVHATRNVGTQHTLLRVLIGNQGDSEAAMTHHTEPLGQTFSGRLHSAMSTGIVFMIQTVVIQYKRPGRTKRINPRQTVKQTPPLLKIKRNDYVTATKHASKYPIRTIMIGSNLTQSLPPCDGQA